MTQVHPEGVHVRCNPYPFAWADSALFSLRLCYAIDCLQHFRVPVKA